VQTLILNKTPINSKGACTAEGNHHSQLLLFQLEKDSIRQFLRVCNLFKSSACQKTASLIIKKKFMFLPLLLIYNLNLVKSIFFHCFEFQNYFERSFNNENI